MKYMIELYRINDRAYLESSPVGRIADEALRHIIEVGVANGEIKKADIVKFKTQKGKGKSIFNLSQPLLADSRKDARGIDRYYAEPIMAYGKPVYLNSQWGDEHKDNLIDWILNWIQVHNLPIVKNTAAGTGLPRVIKGPNQKPLGGVGYGYDENREFVYYNKNVEDDEKVPDLCRKLQIEYLEYIDHFARDLLSQLYGKEFPDPIKVELCKECPSKTYLFNDEYIARKINEVMGKRGSMDAETYAKISRLCMRINGEFIDGSTPKIKIYYNQFKASSMDEYMAKISETLAHEFLHYLEFAYCKMQKSEYYQDERVSEALADFFGVAYSIKRGNDLSCRGLCETHRVDVAKARHALWEELEGSGWPYAYALYFMKNKLRRFSPVFADYKNKGCINKLIEVFNSTPDVADAYDKLKKL